MKKMLTLSLLACTLLFASCSKDKRMERMIYKKDGDWQISTMTYTLVSTDENNVDVVVSGTVENPGTFSFEEGGTGKYSFMLDGVIHMQSFGWANADEAISISRISQNIDFLTGAIQQYVIVLTGEKSDKNQMTLSGTETLQFTTDGEINQSVLTMGLVLEKK